jgi:hypothetical protein
MTTAASHGHPCQWTRSKDKLVPRVQGIHLRRNFLKQIIADKPLTPEILTVKVLWRLLYDQLP